MLHKKRKPSTFTSSSGVDCKYDTARKDMLHSKSTYFYRWSSLVPSVCGLALLFGLGIILNPAINSTEEVYAETIMANPTDYSSISLTISHSNTDGSSTELNTGDTISTNVEPGLVSYITNNLRIDTKKINRFYVSIQAAEDGSSELTGTVNKATIAPVGNNKIPTATDDNGFGDNTWGFALGEANTANESMSYNSLPAYGTSTTPQYSSATNLADGTYNLKLTFAAKINADKPSDHYTTKAMVSVAADAKYISGFINLDTDQPITTMQEMTPNICKYAPDGYSTQLTDNRSASGLGQAKYWVTKLKDGKCWMTQNLDLPLAQGDVLKPDDTDVIENYIVSALDNYSDPGMVNYKINAANGDFASSGCGNPAGGGCSSYFETYTGNIDGDMTAHYLIGNYYPWTIAMAGQTKGNSGSICPKGWKLPTRAEYGTITSLGNNATGSNAVRISPYYFVPAGVYNASYDIVAQRGAYWSSTQTSGYNGNAAAVIEFYANQLYTSSYHNSQGRSVRCITK